MVELASLRDFARMLFCLYRSEGSVVGVAALHQEGTDSGMVRWVYVLPERQRQGIATALMAFLEGEARKMGLRKLRLRTVERAHWALSFYRKMGYHQAGRIEVAWGYDVIMEKRLD